MATAIRELTLSNRLQLEVVLDAFRPGWRSDPGGGSTATIAFLADSGTFVFVAYEDDSPVGWIWGDRFRHPDGRVTASVEHIEVVEAARRRGLGTMLLGAALDLARRQNFTQVRITVPSDSLPVRRLCEQQGASTRHEGFDSYWWDLVPPMPGQDMATDMANPGL